MKKPLTEAEWESGLRAQAAVDFAKMQLHLCEKHEVDLELQARTMLEFLVLAGQRHPGLRALIAQEQERTIERWRCFDRDHNVA